MADVHIYFSVERQNLGDANWAALIVLFEDMGTSDSPMPAFNNHWRARLDGDAVIYESKFDTSEVSIAAFKQLLATEFGVDVGDIVSESTATSYAGGASTMWQFKYNDVNRFKVERFGVGGPWEHSGNETRGYLAANAPQWEPEELP